MGVAEVSFKSKVDWWIGAFLAAMVVLCLLPLVDGFRLNDPNRIRVGFFLLLSILIPLFGVVFPLRYVVTEDSIRIRFGVFRQIVPLSDIRAVVPSKSLMSSPALSRDRLLIVCETRMDVGISPKDEKGFLALLESRSPQLEYSEDGESLRPG